MHATGLPPGGRTDFGAMGADHVLDVGSADALDAPVTWNGGATLGAWAGRPVRLQFHLRRMRIYGFRFVA